MCSPWPTPCCAAEPALEDIDRLRSDVPLMNGLGARLLPDPTTTGDFLRRFTEADLLTLMEAINSVRPQLWRGRGKDLLGGVAYLDVDGTTVPTTGALKQDMDINYKGIWGYAPLVVSLANNFTANQTGGTAREDLVMDGWTDISRRVRAKVAGLPPAERVPEKVLAAFEDSDFEKMEEIRTRVDSIVEDRETARKLKAWYRQLCKRPCFHDEYLQAFNTPGVRLVDTDGKGVERITETGVVVAGREYEVDCIIYASGFEVGTEYTRRAGYDLTGRGGAKLSGYWAEGMRTLHGIHVHGFPNAFVVQPAQGANLISNIPHNITESGRTTATIVKHALDHGFAEVEARKQAEDAWVELLMSGPGTLMRSPDCTPGYYNNEGKGAGPHSWLNVGYPQGPSAYFRYLDEWRDSGEFAGLEFH